MALKLVFSPGEANLLFSNELVPYTFSSGFALSQKRKCIESLHSAIRKKRPSANILEISSKSPDELGVNLSAFNLVVALMDGEKPVSVPVECAFQSAKKFTSGGPFTDLLSKTPRDAKRDQRLWSSGELQSFESEGKSWPLEPRSLFYDWLYIKALSQNPKLSDELVKYDVFTDIEFNHTKSINCQARSAAIYVKLFKTGQLANVLSGKVDFASMYAGTSYFLPQTR